MTFDEWIKNNSEPKPLNECVEVYGCLDLSSHKDSTALILIGLDENNHKHVHAKYWTPAVEGVTNYYDCVMQDIAEWLDGKGIKLDDLEIELPMAEDDQGLVRPLVLTLTRLNKLEKDYE